MYKIGHKHTEETKKKMSESHKKLVGEKNPFFGKLHSSESKIKLREAAIKLHKLKKSIGVHHGFQKGHKFYKLKHDQNMKNKLREANLGEKCVFWKGGGKRNLSKMIRQTFYYRQWRSDIFTRDNFTCQKCGLYGSYLEAHHMKPYSIIVEENNIKTVEDAIACNELWNINNGITLCKNCHDKTKLGVATK